MANVGSNTSIDSGQVAFQYWFNGPMDLPDAADPLSQLTMDCLDATTGTAMSLAVFLSARCCIIHEHIQLDSPDGLEHSSLRHDISPRVWKRRGVCEPVSRVAPGHKGCSYLLMLLQVATT